MTEVVSHPSLLTVPARKTSPPESKGLAVQRWRLIDRLTSQPSDVTILQAPAGFGKTVLAAQMATVIDNPVAWVTLDATDNDPVVMISTVMGALSKAGLNREWDDVPLTGDEPTYSRFVLPHYRVSLESLPGPVTLVLDDAHEVSQSSALSLLRTTVESVPTHSRVVIMGRSLDSLPLAQWLSEDRLTLLTDIDLAMDAQEAAALLTSLNGEVPIESAVERILSATGGWPIAVYLQARATDPSRLTDSAQFASFLDDEVLRNADAETIRFLTAVSPLSSLSAALCNHVLQSTNSGQLLSQAEETSLLVTRSKDRVWYQLHPLLRDHLSQRFRAREPEFFRTVMRRASEWKRRAGFAELAIAYAREAGDSELLGKAIWEAAPAALMAGQGQRVHDWLAATDDREIAGACTLSLSAAWAAMTRGEAAIAQRWAQAAFANASEGWESNPAWSTVEAGLALLLSINGAIGYERSAQLGAKALRALLADHALRPFAQMHTGWMQAMAGSWEVGADDIRRAAQLAQARGLPGLEVDANSLLATLLLCRGDDAQAESLILESLDAWENAGISHSLATRAVFAAPATWFAARSGRAELARYWLQQSEQVVTTMGTIIPWLVVVIESFAATAYTQLGDGQRAGRHLVRAERAARSLPPSPLLTHLLVTARETVEDGLQLSALSPAERRVWELLLTRATLREIADALFVSPETIKTQTRSIYRKLGVSSRREAQEIGDRFSTGKERIDQLR